MKLKLNVTRGFWIGLVASVLIAVSSHGQSIPGINYQGVARDLNGNPQSNQSISIRISILTGSPNGTFEYSEIHDLTTNQFGLFNLVIGQGGPEVGQFSEIDWSNTNKWLQIEMDSRGGSNFQLMGSQQLLSVPFAYFAAQAGQNLSTGEGLEINNNTIVNTAPDRPITLTGQGSIQVDGEYPEFTLTGTDSVNDADPDPTNELLTSAILSGTDLELSDAGGTQVVDLSSLSNTGTDNQNLTFNSATGQLSIDSGNTVTITDVDAANELITGAQLTVTDLEITDAGGTTTVDLSSLVADADASPTNELQDLGNVLSRGNDAGAVKIANLAEPTVAQDAATKNYVDNISIDDADSDPANEVQDLDSVLSTGNDAGGALIKNLSDPADPQDAATRSYVDAADALSGLDYAFKVQFSYTNPTAATQNDILIDLSAPDFDDQMALNGTDYVAPIDGIFIFFVQGISTGFIPLEIMVNGTPQNVLASPATSPAGTTNSLGTYMYKLNANDVIQLKISSIPMSQTVSGEFFGHKL